MTNETTASQPKSIGDDVMRIRDEVDWENGFVRLLEGYKHATDHGICSRESVQAQIIAYVRSRAPAAQASTTIQAAPEGFALVPDYRGYANLGTGQYVLNNSDAGEMPELIISIATDEERSGRVIGEKRPNKPGYLIQPENMAVRIRFSSLAGLEVLEGQLRDLRAEHFPAATIQEPVMVAEPDWRHAANEWADTAYSGLQWLRNIEDGTTTDVKSARENMESCCQHAREVADKVSAPMVADPAGVTLSDGEIIAICNRIYPRPFRDNDLLALNFARAIESALAAATVKAVPSEALKHSEALIAQSVAVRGFSEGVRDAGFPNGDLLVTMAMRFAEKLVPSIAAPLADKTGGGE